MRCLGLALLWCLAACSDGSRAKPAHPATAYQPEVFADVPLPPGFQPMPEVDQVAWVVAGGHLRILDTTLGLSVSSSPLAEPKALIEWFQVRLSGLGWTRVDGHGDRPLWSKGQERLELRTGREDSRPIMRILLTAGRP